MSDAQGRLGSDCSPPPGFEGFERGLCTTNDDKKAEGLNPKSIHVESLFDDALAKGAIDLAVLQSDFREDLEVSRLISITTHHSGVEDDDDDEGDVNVSSDDDDSDELGNCSRVATEGVKDQQQTSAPETFIWSDDDNEAAVLARRRAESSRSSWWRPDMKRREAESNLKNLRPGRFFLRKSATTTGCLCLSLNFNEHRTLHQLVLQTQGEIPLVYLENSHRRFNSSSDLVAFYSIHHFNEDLPVLLDFCESSFSGPAETNPFFEDMVGLALEAIDTPESVPSAQKPHIDEKEILSESAKAEPTPTTVPASPIRSNRRR